MTHFIPISVPARILSPYRFRIRSVDPFRIRFRILTVTSKVTLLNTCEKLKMTHEKQLELILGI
jgi:hypothetical protein